MDANKGKVAKKTRSGKWKIALAVVCCLVVVAAFAGRLRAGSVSEGEPVQARNLARPPTMVQFAQAKTMRFYDSISADGELKSRYYSPVSPRISGVIDDIFVREGDRVYQGETELFQIDSEKLRQAVDHARQSLVIARSSLDEKKANMVKAKADVDQAEKDYQRNASLYDQNVIPLAEFEIYETKLAQLDAQLEVAATNVTLAEQNVTLAQISLSMNEKDLRDSVMHAPIDGVVSGRYAEPGQMGSPGSPIIRIDGTEELKAVAYLPGQFYPRIAVGRSLASVTVLGKKIGDFPITYKAPGIDSALRTFEVWADVPGDGEYAVFGAQCVFTVILKETEGVGVPRGALQFRAGKYWLFLPDGDVAKMIEVNPGLESDGWTELIDSPLAPGDRVITQGQFLLEDGYPIRELAR